MEAWKRSALSTGLIIQATRIVNEDWGTFARRKVLNEKRLSIPLSLLYSSWSCFSHYTLSVEYPPFSFLSFFIHSHILNALFDNCIQLQVTNLSRQSLYLVERWSCKNKELIEGEDPRFKSHFSSFPIVMKALSCSDVCNALERGGRIYERYWWWWWRCFCRIKEESSSFPFILWCCDPYIIGIKHHVIS